MGKNVTKQKKMLLMALFAPASCEWFLMTWNYIPSKKPTNENMISKIKTWEKDDDEQRARAQAQKKKRWWYVLYVVCCGVLKMKMHLVSR